MEIHPMNDATTIRPGFRRWTRSSRSGLFCAAAMLASLVSVIVILRLQMAESDARRADLSARCERIGGSLHQSLSDSYCVTDDGTIKGVPPKRP